MSPVNASSFCCFNELKTSAIEVAFETDLELLNSKRDVDLVAQEFKHVMSLALCNPPKSRRLDPKRDKQSPRPFPRVFILKEMNASVGVVWYRD